MQLLWAEREHSRSFEKMDCVPHARENVVVLDVTNQFDLSLGYGACHVEELAARHVLLSSNPCSGVFPFCAATFRETRPARILDNDGRFLI